MHTVAIQGYEHSYHDILRKHKHPESTMLGLPDFYQVVERVRDGQASLGIIAVSNSIYGATPAQLEIRRNFEDMVVVGEDYLNITHRLVGTRHEPLTVIESHPVAIGQCRETIKQLYPDVKIVESDDTARSIQSVAERARKGIYGVAAIGSLAAAQAYDNLTILEDEFNDETPNETRFLTFRKANTPYDTRTTEDADKTSTILTIPNRDGSLATVLRVLLEHNMGFSSIEASSDRVDSRNSTVVVPLDIDHGWDSEEFTLATKELEALGVKVKNLGSYKSGRDNVLKV